MKYFRNPKTGNYVKTNDPQTAKDLKAAGWKLTTERKYYEWLRSIPI